MDVHDNGAALAPGSVIGILGGGQLGRMLAIAAARLGYRCHIFCPEAGGPAEQVAFAATHGDYEDDAELDQFAAQVDAITIEFENIPAATLKHLATQVPVRPSAAALAVTQDRLTEKDAVVAAGFGTADYRPVASLEALDAALAEIAPPAILKTRRFGYDGKGQAGIQDAGAAAPAWRAIGEAPAIVEARIDFTMEASVVVARGGTGEAVVFGPMWNRHVDHILDTTVIPAPISDAQAAEAVHIGRTLADRLDIVGILTVELFVDANGGLLVNEMAPRVHNSGHWTIEACVSDQFEQQIRAVAGLPLGSAERHHDAVMKNLIGDDARDWRALAADPAVHLHLYGKSEIRAGRKMGHVTRLFPLGSNPDGGKI